MVTRIHGKETISDEIALLYNNHQVFMIYLITALSNYRFI